MMRAHEQEIMREALQDLHETPAWGALLTLAVEESRSLKQRLLLSTNTEQTARAELIGQFQGVYKFFDKIARETKHSLPPSFIEHFTGKISE